MRSCLQNKQTTDYFPGIRPRDFSQIISTRHKYQLFTKPRSIGNSSDPQKLFLTSSAGVRGEQIFVYPVNTDYASVSPCRRIILQNLIKRKLSFDHGLWRQILSNYEIKKIVPWSRLWFDTLKTVGISEVWELVQNLPEQLNTSPSLLSSLSLRLSKWGKRIIGQKNPVLGYRSWISYQNNYAKSYT